MGNIILKPSTFAYDGMNSIEEILGEYNAYLKLLPYNELKREFEERKSAWLGLPTILNIRMYQRSKAAMLERGLLSERIKNINGKNPEKLRFTEFKKGL